MSKKNKLAGNKWEVELRNIIRETFDLTEEEVQTSRRVNKLLDAKKVDIVDPTEYIHQAKVNSKKSINVFDILQDMDEYKKQGEIPIVNIKQREKRKSRFYTIGHMSIMYTEDLFNLLKELHELRRDKRKNENSS